ncbi:ABC transporter ATP-binding protein [Mycolicibacterium goodii]|uniref:ABC transporter ATP-binding protein n=1 Tax=Mycolicibacterium goodii TaxID=134601 RepID=UPI001BDC8CA1|nr:ABC transporter ATP-binding protein [Mycolicibacterium goodii]MBU8829755.1 ABC transporter ATP-binding protein [Mycolicibacterium goodii]
MNSPIQAASRIDTHRDASPQSARLQANEASFGYERRPVCHKVSTAIPDGALTAIIGPNACGKSTLLRGLGRLLKPLDGAVTLDGKPIGSYQAKEFARRIALLPQASIAPDGITVADLVARGRFPHQTFLRQWSEVDANAVTEAMAMTRIESLSGRRVSDLSGGQRQRVWIAMVLAQHAEIMLLDEPTTFLDIAHQIELLHLLTELRRAGRTIVAVLHDLNQAARYATHLIAMKDGEIVAEGPPREVVTAELVEVVFGIRSVISADPVSGTPAVFPLNESPVTVPNLGTG